MTNIDAEQSSSDPLPYTQVDRAVKPKATHLASLMGTTPQHALGSLVEFWDLNGEPRDIEKLVAAGQREVVVDRETLLTRFEIASGKTIEPAKLIALGLVEARPGGLFRVRGMSRYFVPITSRLEARERARKAGLASAEARRAKNGTAQPRKMSQDGSEDVRGDVREMFDGMFGAGSAGSSGAGSESVAQPPNPTEPAVSGQRSSSSSLSGESPRKTPPPRVIDTPAMVFWAWANTLRCASGHIDEDPPRNLSGWWSTALMRPDVDESRMRVAFERFLGNEFYRGMGAPFERFQAKWPELASAHYGKRKAGDDTAQGDGPLTAKEIKL